MKQFQDNNLNKNNKIKDLKNIIVFLLLFIIPVVLICLFKIPNFNQLIEYLKISWWPLIIIYVLFIFKNNIKEFIDKHLVKNIKTPSGYDIDFINQSDYNEERQNIIVDDKDPIIRKLIKESFELKEHSLETEQKLRIREMELDFERIYRVIFGSQLELLKILLKGDYDLTNMALYYRYVKEKHLTLQQWNLQQYLDLLFKSKLIEKQDNRYKATFKCRVFIAYINSRGYNLPKSL